MKRAKREGLARNAAIALGNSGDRAVVPAVATALHTHDSAIVRGHAAWALGQLGGSIARSALDSARTTDPDAYVLGEITVALETG